MRESQVSGSLYVVALCSCMTDASSVPREECSRCDGTGVEMVKMGLRDQEVRREAPGDDHGGHQADGDHAERGEAT